MMKISKQMANKAADLQIMKKTIGTATIYAIFRDASFRTTYFLLFNKLNEKFLQNNKYDT